ncbi:MAG TPA: hypothetical protein VK835_05880 [Bacteroidia bacterium]|jgi:hypothetical protein|nr:hypothetical protein [Bacteroidia bacterium]
MKTKISVVFISLLFLMSCGSSEQPKNETPESNKMILKAYNNMYVVVYGDTAVTANQPDAAKAEVFEKIDQGNGKWALKTSSGKFLTDEASKDHFVLATKTQVGATEQFEIINLENSQINIKASTGKAISADLYLGHKLIANRDQASGWETFTAEPK